MSALASWPVIGLAGPTASGKTALSLRLCEWVAPLGPVEIISVDSALVYRGMDIGTAKPTLAERQGVPHHLIDICDPTESYSAAAFVRDVERLVGEIRTRGAWPLLVGGTMMYFKALMDGLSPLPMADPAVRARLDAQAAQVGWPAMHARLAAVDPVSAARLNPNDSQRVQRALEVWEISGQPLSALQSHAHAPGVLRPDHLISLEPDDRAWLHARIAQRFDAMLVAGLMDEVKALHARGDLHADLPSMRCVGYRQAWDVLEGRWPTGSLRERGIAATRQLAKRQITWLRSMGERLPVACDGADPWPALQARVRQVTGGAL